MLFVDAQIGASRGDAVIGLLERAHVPPLPPFYKLCYDYLAGARTLDAVRAGAILESSLDDPGTAHEQLYADFIEPYRSDESISKAVSTMVERIQVLEKLIIDTQDVARAQRVTLADASHGLQGKDLNAVLMREWIVRLAATHMELHATNSRLKAELDNASAVFAGAKDEMAKVSRESTVDPLTCIANRAGLDDALVTALAEAADGRSRLALAVVDIDHFKRLNDTYGHQAGDEILRLVARALTTSMRSGDVAGRLGGDEFMVIFKDEDATSSLQVAERIRSAIKDCDVTLIFGRDVLGSITASIGIATYRSGETAPTLFDRADQRLFEAKAQGRNRVVGETATRNAA